MKAEFTVLGCSVSSGVPAIGNDWGNCDADEPKNRRDRPCALLRSENTAVIIDTGPDFRQQLTRIGLKAFDAVLYTHAHSDHIMGIDELRIVKFRNDNKLMPVYGDEDTIQTLEQRFDYMFKDQSFYKRVLDAHIIHKSDFGKTATIGDLEYIPFYQDHGDMTCLGYRFGNVGYSADMKEIDQSGIETLKGIDIWIADGAGHHQKNHPTHASLEKIYELNQTIKAKKVYVVGLSKFMDYQTLKNELPEGFAPAYDGLSVEVTYS